MVLRPTILAIIFKRYFNGIFHYSLLIGTVQKYCSPAVMFSRSMQIFAFILIAQSAKITIMANVVFMAKFFLLFTILLSFSSQPPFQFNLKGKFI